MNMSCYICLFLVCKGDVEVCVEVNILIVCFVAGRKKISDCKPIEEEQ